MNIKRNIRAIVLYIVTALFIFPAVLSAQSAEGKVWIIPIQGNIEPSMTAFVRREARRALSHGAEYLVFEIDTFGGRVDAALQIASFITSVRDARTVAWVHNHETALGVSWSAGALIALACTDIFMAPGTSIGAAAPVMASPGGAAEAAGEKTVAAVRSQMAALAERNGHPVGIALAMVDFDVELWEVIVNGETRALTLPELERLERDTRAHTQVERVGLISPVGKLLSLTAGEAVQYGLAVGLAEDLNSLLTALGRPDAEVVQSRPSAADSIVTFLTSGPVQAVLILLGLVLIFMEIQSPGFGVPGALGVISFLMVFGSGALLGRVGSLEILLFLIGVALLAVELFILPGFGVMGVSGIILIGVSLVFSMQDFVVPQFEWEWALLGRNVTVVFAGLLSAVVGIAALALMGPKIRIFEPIMLKTMITGTAGGPDPDVPQGKTYTDAKAHANVHAAAAGASLLYSDDENHAALLGKTGIADSALRPSGRARIEGVSYTVEADNEFVDPGTEIQVKYVRGNRIIVKKYDRLA